MEVRKLNIKNMVCNRCIKVVGEELEKLGLKAESVILGEVIISSEKKVDVSKIKEMLEQNGFELIDDKQAKLVENIKIGVINMIHNYSGSKKINFSTYISEKLGMSYQYISSLFSSMEGITLEKYIINQKIEKVKELLVYDELNLNEISYKLDYSSVQHLSNQFKKVTGFTPSEFKKLKIKPRISIDKV
jgi:AraC family transcriptional regulator